MKNLVQKFILPVLVILTSLIYGLPNILIVLSHGELYTPFTLTNSPIARDEVFAYAPEVNYMLKGHLFLKEAYVAEYASHPTPFMGESAPSLVFATLAKLTGSIESAFVAGDFIFPPLVFLLLYIITNTFLRNRLYSSAVAFLVVIARDFIAVIPFPRETWQYLTFAEGQNYLLYFSRAFHPQLTFIFFGLSFIFLLKVLTNPSSKKYVILLGVFFGILFYSYIFYWTYFVAFYALVLAYLLIKKEKRAITALVFSSCIAFVIASPYLYTIHSFYQLSIAPDFVAKSSLKNVPLPFTLIRYLLIALLLFLSVRKKDKKFKVFVLFILTGVLIAPVAKLIVGQDLETFHYLRRALMPFATVGIFTFIYFIFKKRKNVIIFLSFGIIFTFITYGFNVQMVASKVIQASHTKDLYREDVFTWLRANTPKESVVGSVNTDFESFLPVYTQNKVYFPPSDRTVTPTYEGVTRYAVMANLLGINADWQKKNLDNIISYLFIYQSYDKNLNLNLNSDKRKEAEAEISIQSEGLWKQTLNKFKLDYVVITPLERDQVKINANLLKNEVSFGRYTIYSLNK